MYAIFNSQKNNIYVLMFKKKPKKNSQYGQSAHLQYALYLERKAITLQNKTWNILINVNS